MNHEFGFIFCAVLSRERLYVGGVALELEDAGHPHAILFERHDKEWTRWSMEHRLAGIAAYADKGTDKLLSVSTTGHVEIADSEGADEEQIGDESGAPNRLRPLWCVRIVGHHAYTAGAQRQVYRRQLDTPGWQAVHDGCLIARDSADIGSFHGIDGRDEDLLVAVGMGGAVWRRADGIWKQLDSPTSRTLECVRYLGGQQFIAAGAGGTLVSIDGDALRPIIHGVTDENFADCAVAFGATYLCTGEGTLFKLEGDTLTRVDTGLPPSIGGGTLSYADSLLVFVTNTRVVSFDGAHWTELDPSA